MFACSGVLVKFIKTCQESSVIALIRDCEIKIWNENIITMILLVVLPRGGSSPTIALTTVYYYKELSWFNFKLIMAHKIRISTAR